jgi:hypothetical protein
LCEWEALRDPEIAGKIFDFLKGCPSERLNEPKISKLIMESIVNGIKDSNSAAIAGGIKKSASDTIDFLHFIRYMHIIYKSDISLRLKFLYGVSMHDPQSKIEIYNNIFSVLQSKYEIFKKQKHLRGYTCTPGSTCSSSGGKSTFYMSPTATPTTHKDARQKSMSFSELLAKSDSSDNLLVDVVEEERPTKSDPDYMTEPYILIDNLDRQEVQVDDLKTPGPVLEPKVGLPAMNQDEFISFWRIIYNLFMGMDNESEMYHAAATVSTLLLKLGEVSRKFHNASDQQPTLDLQKLIDLESAVNEDVEATAMPILKDKTWTITFEQLIASLLTDNLLVQYFDEKFDLNKVLREYKSQHA